MADVERGDAVAVAGQDLQIAEEFDALQAGNPPIRGDPDPCHIIQLFLAELAVAVCVKVLAQVAAEVRVGEVRRVERNFSREDHRQTRINAQDIVAKGVLVIALLRIHAASAGRREVRRPAHVEVGQLVAEHPELPQVGRAAQIQRRQIVVADVQEHQRVQIAERQARQAAVLRRNVVQLCVEVQIQRLDRIGVAAERLKQRVAAEIQPRQLVGEDREALQLGVAAQIQRRQLVAVGRQPGQRGIGRQIQTRQLVAVAGQVVELGVLAQVQLGQLVVVADELVQIGELAHIQARQAAARDVKRRQLGVAAQIERGKPAVGVRFGHNAVGLLDPADTEQFEVGVRAQIQRRQFVVVAVEVLQRGQEFNARQTLNVHPFDSDHLGRGDLGLAQAAAGVGIEVQGDVVAEVLVREVYFIDGDAGVGHKAAPEQSAVKFQIVALHGGIAVAHACRAAGSLAADLRIAVHHLQQPRAVAQIQRRQSVARALEEIQLGIGRQIQSRQLVAPAMQAPQLRERAQIQACQLVAADAEHLQSGQVAHVEGGQPVMIAEEALQRGVVAQIQGRQQVVAAVHLEQRGVGMQVQRGQLVPKAAQQLQRGAAHEVQADELVIGNIHVFQLVHAVEVHAGQTVGGALDMVKLGIVPHIQRRQQVVRAGKALQLRERAHIQRGQPVGRAADFDQVRRLAQIQRGQLVAVAEQLLEARLAAQRQLCQPVTVQDALSADRIYNERSAVEERQLGVLAHVEGGQLVAVAGKRRQRGEEFDALQALDAHVGHVDLRHHAELRRAERAVAVGVDMLHDPCAEDRIGEGLARDRGLLGDKLRGLVIAQLLRDDHGPVVDFGNAAVIADSRSGLRLCPIGEERQQLGAAADVEAADVVAFTTEGKQLRVADDVQRCQVVVAHVQGKQTGGGREIQRREVVAAAVQGTQRILAAQIQRGELVVCAGEVVELAAQRQGGQRILVAEQLGQSGVCTQIQRGKLVVDQAELRQLRVAAEVQHRDMAVVGAQLCELGEEAHAGEFLDIGVGAINLRHGQALGLGEDAVVVRIEPGDIAAEGTVREHSIGVDERLDKEALGGGSRRDDRRSAVIVEHDEGILLRLLRGCRIGIIGVADADP